MLDGHTLYKRDIDGTSLCLALDRNTALTGVLFDREGVAGDMSGAQNLAIPNAPEARRKFLRKWARKNAKRMAAGLSLSILFLPMAVQAQEQGIDPTSISGVSNATVLEDGSLRIELSNGQTIVVAADDVTINPDGSITISSAAANEVNVLASADDEGGVGYGGAILAAVGGLGLAGAGGAGGGGSGGGGSAASSLDGFVIDGYIAGATVWADAPGGTEGVLDEGEVSTTTDENGVFDVNLLPRDLPLYGMGGIDISTGEPFVGLLSAPAGGTILTPITTLIQQRAQDKDISTEEAEAEIRTLLDLGDDVDLLNDDPVELAEGGDLSLLILNAKIAAFIAIVAAAAPDGLDAAAVSDGLLELLSAGIDGEPTKGFVLDSAEFVDSIIDEIDGINVDPGLLADALSQAIAALDEATTLPEIEAIQQEISDDLLAAIAAARGQASGEGNPLQQYNEGEGNSDDAAGLRPVVDSMLEPDQESILIINCEPVSFSGTGRPGSTVTVQLGEAEASGEVGYDGTWHITIYDQNFYTGDDENPDLLPVVTASYENEDFGDVTSPPAVNVDTYSLDNTLIDPPTITSPENGAVFYQDDRYDGESDIQSAQTEGDGGSNVFDGWYPEGWGLIEVTGTAPADSDVQVGVAGGQYNWTVTADGDGNWTAVIPVPSTDATIEARVIEEPSGLPGEAATVDVTADFIAPYIDYFGVDRDHYVYMGEPSDDDEEGDRENVAEGDNVFAFYAEVRGAEEVTFRLYDGEGTLVLETAGIKEEGGSDRGEKRGEKEPPELSEQAQANRQVLIDKEIIFDKEPPEPKNPGVDYEIDYGTYEDWYATFDVSALPQPFEEGRYDIEVVASDGGNESSADTDDGYNGNGFYYDTTPPNVVLVSSEVVGNYLNFTITTDEPGYLNINNSFTGRGRSFNEGDFVDGVATWTDSIELYRGENEIDIYGENRSGLETELESFTVTSDSGMLPYVEIDYPGTVDADDLDGFEFTGTGFPDAALTLRIYSQDERGGPNQDSGFNHDDDFAGLLQGAYRLELTTIVDDDGNWVIEDFDPSILADGQYYVEVRQSYDGSYSYYESTNMTVDLFDESSVIVALDESETLVIDSGDRRGGGRDFIQQEANVLFEGPDGAYLSGTTMGAQAGSTIYAWFEMPEGMSDYYYYGPGQSLFSATVQEDGSFMFYLGEDLARRFDDMYEPADFTVGFIDPEFFGGGFGPKFGPGQEANIGVIGFEMEAPTFLSSVSGQYIVNSYLNNPETGVYLAGDHFVCLHDDLEAQVDYLGDGEFFARVTDIRDYGDQTVMIGQLIVGEELAVPFAAVYDDASGELLVARIFDDGFDGTSMEEVQDTLNGLFLTDDGLIVARPNISGSIDLEEDTFEVSQGAEPVVSVIEIASGDIVSALSGDDWSDFPASSISKTTNINLSDITDEYETIPPGFVTVMEPIDVIGGNPVALVALVDLNGEHDDDIDRQEIDLDDDEGIGEIVAAFVASFDTDTGEPDVVLLDLGDFEGGEIPGPGYFLEYNDFGAPEYRFPVYYDHAGAENADTYVSINDHGEFFFITEGSLSDSEVFIADGTDHAYDGGRVYSNNVPFGALPEGTKDDTFILGSVDAGGAVMFSLTESEDGSEYTIGISVSPGDIGVQSVTGVYGIDFFSNVDLSPDDRAELDGIANLVTSTFEGTEEAPFGIRLLFNKSDVDALTEDPVLLAEYTVSTEEVDALFLGGSIPGTTLDEFEGIFVEILDPNHNTSGGVTFVGGVDGSGQQTVLLTNDEYNSGTETIVGFEVGDGENADLLQIVMTGDVGTIRTGIEKISAETMDGFPGWGGDPGTGIIILEGELDYLTGTDVLVEIADYAPDFGFTGETRGDFIVMASDGTDTGVFNFSLSVANTPDIPEEIAVLKGVDHEDLAAMTENNVELIHSGFFNEV